MTKNLQNARETLEQMYLERDEMGEVTFLVDGQRIRAHRNVLATQSPKYKAQFYGPHRDEGDIHVPYVSATAFNVFLQFFYKETVGLTMDNIETVLDLSQQSLADTFIGTCVNFLNDAIKANKVCVPYRLATIYDIEPLRVECERRITTNTMAVLASDDFLHCDRDVLLQILKLDTLNCSETDVFTACIAWAREQCKRDNLDDGKPENLRAALGDAVYQIRFSSLNADEFAALHKSMKGFFTADESFELLYITAKLRDCKSPKFNLALRTPRIEPKESATTQPAWSQEVNRFIRIKGPASIADKTKSTLFDVFSNKPIRLHGFSLGMHLTKTDLNDFPKFLPVKFRHDDSIDAFCKVYQSPARYNETMVIFEKPIERVRFFSCLCPLPSKLPKNEFVLHSLAKNDNFEIRVNGKWVTRFFFDEYNA